ncbi:MAG: amidohydrolase family protein [Candidatus Latescibacterota bacterium]|nr:amidohydrolase family protein [Candidatus Latescibacterota bacterium]
MIYPHIGHPQLLLPDAVIDGSNGESKAGQAVLVDKGVIAQVGEAESVRNESPHDTIAVDLAGAILCPGLIDGHTHLSLAGDGRNYDEMFSETDEMMVMTGTMNMIKHLQAGITTIREHGARNRVGFALKEGLQRGYIPGPRMQVSGRPITCTGGHFWVCNEEADGEEEIRKSVRRLVHEGADYIKIMASGGGTRGTIPGRASYTREELHAAAHEAHHFDRPTAAHCRARESMKRAVQAGIDLMEHAEFLDPDDEMRFDPEIAAMMEESRIWISPTLQAWTKYPRIVDLKNQRDLGSLSHDGKIELDRLEKSAEVRLDVMRKLLEYDVKERVLPGTDSGVGMLAFGHLDYDLELLVGVGFSPAEAIVSATRISADAIGMSETIGTIEAGKVADLVAFDGDPSKDIYAARKVRAVFQSGKRIR